jgi:hypothetical protein
MREDICTVLYRETYGAAEDNEAENPNGIVVCLSHWEVGSMYVPDHFLLECKVMIDRQIVVHELSVTGEHWKLATREQMLRKAIQRFDELKELNPDIKEGRLAS